MAIVDVSGKGGATVESFDGRHDDHEVRRLRLSAEEASALRYILGGLSIEDPAGWRNVPPWDTPSTFGAMLEKLAAKECADFSQDLPEDRGDYIHVHSALRGGTRPDVDSMVERWSGDRTGEGYQRRHDVMRAWRGLTSLARAQSRSAAVLMVQYGPLPPGLPVEGMWPRPVDAEYRRVVRLVPESGGSSHALEQRVRINEKRREGDSDATHRERILAARRNRRATLDAIGHLCEQIIVRAANDYRSAVDAG